MKCPRSLSVVLLSIAPIVPTSAQDAPSAAAGARIYENNCATCHGEGLENNANIAFDLRRLKAGEHERFVDSVLHGKNNKMPPWEGLLDGKQIESLWAYIRANAYK